MATILPFAPRPATATRRPEGAPPASILLFTGVRYERLRTDLPDATGSGEGRAGRRPRRRGGQK